MKQKLLKTMLLLCALVVGSSNVWATDPTYKLTQVTSVSAGNKYVFVQNSCALSNTVSSNALQTASSYSTTGLSGTEAYVWILESATGGFYLKNASLKSSQYLNNTSSTSVSFGSQNSIWTIAFTDGVALISNKSNSNRFLGDTKAKSGWANTYKAYATGNLSSYYHDFTVYVLEDETATGTTPSDLALTGAPITLDFDLYNNADPQAITYTTSSTGAVTISGGTGYITTSVNSSTKTITITPTGVTPSTQTITVNQAADATYAAGSATFTVNVTDSDPAIKISFNNALYGTSYTGTDAKDNGPFNGTVSGVKVTVKQGSGSNLYVNDSETRIYSGSPDKGSISLEAPTGYVITEIVFTTGDWSVTADPDGLSSKTWTGCATSVVFSATGRSDFKTAKVTLAPGTVVSAAGYTTYVTPEAVEFTGVTAYTVTTVGGSSVSLKEVESAPANTPVVIEADEDAYEFTPTDSPASVGTNLLEASDGTVEGDGSTIYALGNKSGVGFYLVKNKVKVPTGKAYLDLSGSPVKEFLSFEFEDAPDGISLTPTLSEDEGEIYNLAGQRISKMQKGINIVNGKKILF